MANHTLSITIEVQVAENANCEAVYNALTGYHPEEYKAFVERLLKGNPVCPDAAGAIRDPKFHVAFLPNESQREEIVQWMRGQVEDGLLDPDDLTRRCVNWGLWPAAEVLDEVEQRMAITNDDDVGESEGDSDDPPARLPIIEPPRAPVPETPTKSSSLLEVLDEVEGFIANFEDDKALAVNEMLERLRRVQKVHSTRPSVEFRVAFTALFKTLVGGKWDDDGSQANPRFRALWPVNGVYDSKAYSEARRAATLEVLAMLERPHWADFIDNDIVICDWLNEEGWSIVE